MANRFIQSEMWNDSKFADDFTPEDKFFWLMLLTTRYGNLAGCFEFSKKQMSNDSGYNEQTIENLLYRFINIHKMIDYDFETKEVLILKWYKYNWTSSPKFETSLKGFIEKIKSEKFKNYIIKSYEKYCKDRVAIPYQYHTSSISISSSISNSIEIEPELKESVKEKAKSKRFVKPTLEEVEMYVNDNYKTDAKSFAEKFINHYESKGWLIGKAPMKDWKAAIRTWVGKDNIQKKTISKVQDDISDEEYLKLLKELKQA